MTPFTMPARVHIASWVWILFGSFGIICCPMKAFAVALYHVSPFLILIITTIPVGMYLLWCGQEATYRHLRDILIPASVSMTLGILFQTFSTTLIVAKMIPPGTSAIADDLQQFSYETIVIYALMGMVLLAAGYLALSRRQEYREWVRRSKMPDERNQMMLSRYRDRNFTSR